MIDKGFSNLGCLCHADAAEGCCRQNADIWANLPIAVVSSGSGKIYGCLCQLLNWTGGSKHSTYISLSFRATLQGRGSMSSAVYFVSVYGHAPRPWIFRKLDKSSYFSAGYVARLHLIGSDINPEKLW